MIPSPFSVDTIRVSLLFRNGPSGPDRIWLGLKTALISGQQIPDTGTRYEILGGEFAQHAMPIFGDDQHFLYSRAVISLPGICFQREDHALFYFFRMFH
jgi:hypothetical protein